MSNPSTGTGDWNIYHRCDAQFSVFGSILLVVFGWQSLVGLWFSHNRWSVNVSTQRYTLRKIQNSSSLYIYAALMLTVGTMIWGAWEVRF